MFQVNCLSTQGELCLGSTGEAALTEDICKKAEPLFASAEWPLKRDGDFVRTDAQSQPGPHALALCIAITGLNSLTKEG